VPDAPGFAGWVGALNGGLARTTVVLDFAECGEHARDDLANTLSSSAALPGVVTLGPVAASAAVVAAGLDALQAEVAEGAVTGISLTDAGTATIPITVAQLATDAGALHFISGSYWLNVGAVSVENAGSIVQADNLGATTSAAYVAFSDGRLVFSDSDPAAVIYRLYLSALGRVADPSGLAGWTGVLQGGTPLVAIAQDFIGCGEFARHYGTNLSDPAFVTLLYENVLGRAPDGTGLAADVAALGAGTSRAAMLVNFSESPEHIADTNSAIHAGIWDAW
jgi:hypothetical protein